MTVPHINVYTVYIYSTYNIKYNYIYVIYLVDAMLSNGEGMLSSRIHMCRRVQMKGLVLMEYCSVVIYRVDSNCQSYPSRRPSLPTMSRIELWHHVNCYCNMNHSIYSGLLKRIHICCRDRLEFGFSFGLTSDETATRMQQNVKKQFSDEERTSTFHSKSL